MKKNMNIIYHVFLFLSIFTRGLVEVFSLVLLYKKGFSIQYIFLFLFFMYMIGIVVNYISLTIAYKKVLIISSFLYGISFLYLSFMKITMISLIILAILLAFSNYSFHAIKHLLALKLLDSQKKDTNRIVIVTYLGVIVSSLIGIYLIEKLPLYITSILVFGLSFLSIIPVLKLNNCNDEVSNKVLKKVRIQRSKIYFNVLEQFKVIFLEIQPLFLYMYVDNSISYVGIFNVIVNLASLIVVYFLVKKFNKKYFKYICFLLGGIFLLKLNLRNEILLLGLAFFEGIFVKLYENVSLGNLYNLENNSIREYLIIEEFIFFGSKSLILLLVCLFRINIYIVLYIAIIGIVCSGFFIRDNKFN